MMKNDKYKCISFFDFSSKMKVYWYGNVYMDFVTYHCLEIGLLGIC